MLLRYLKSSTFVSPGEVPVHIMYDPETLSFRSVIARNHCGNEIDESSRHIFGDHFCPMRYGYYSNSHFFQPLLRRLHVTMLILMFLSPVELAMAAYGNSHLTRAVETTPASIMLRKYRRRPRRKFTVTS